MGVVGVDGKGGFGAGCVGEVARLFILRGTSRLLLFLAGFVMLVCEGMGDFGEFGGIGVGVVVVRAVWLAIETADFGGFLVAVGADVVVVAVFGLLLTALVAARFLFNDGGEVVGSLGAGDNAASA